MATRKKAPRKRSKKAARPRTPTERRARRPRRPRKKKEPERSDGEKFVTGMFGKVLDAFEEDPEMALKKLEVLGKAGAKVLEEAKKNPEAVKRVALPILLKNLAKTIKRNM